MPVPVLSSGLMPLAWSPNGAFIASLDREKDLIAFYEANTATRLWSFPLGFTSWDLAWNPMSDSLLVGTDDGSFSLHIVSHTLIRILPELDGPIHTLSFSPDGTLAVLCDGVVHVFNGAHILPDHAEEEVTSLQWSPDGHFLATGTFEGTVRIWEADTGRLTHTFRHSHVWALEWGNSGIEDAHVLFSGGDDFSLCIWDPHIGNLQKSIPIGGNIYRISAGSQGLLALEMESDLGSPQEVWLCDIASGACSPLIDEDGAHFAEAAWNPQGNCLGLIRSNGEIALRPRNDLTARTLT
ncbi:MAG: hypothetical protein Q4C87_09250 [Actinomycetaceae bacterium]|nr:hypothetical protein [Actinomycetaceae bacterium]